MVPAFTTCQLLTPDMMLLRATPDAIFRGAVVCPKFERYELKSVTMVFEVPSASYKSMVSVCVALLSRPNKRKGTVISCSPFALVAMRTSVTASSEPLLSPVLRFTLDATPFNTA